MSTKDILTDMLRQAIRYDRLNDVVLRDQMLRSIFDLPLPISYIRAAILRAGRSNKT